MAGFAVLPCRSLDRTLFNHELELEHETYRINQAEQ